MAVVAHWKLLQVVYVATVMLASGYVTEMVLLSHVRVTLDSTPAAVVAV